VETKLVSQVSWGKGIIKLKLVVSCCLFSEGPDNEGHGWEEMAGLFWHVPAGGRAPTKQYGERLVTLTQRRGVLSGIQNEMCVTDGLWQFWMAPEQGRSAFTRSHPQHILAGRKLDFCQVVKTNLAFAVDAVLVTVWVWGFFFSTLSSLQSPKIEARFSEVFQK